MARPKTRWSGACGVGVSTSLAVRIYKKYGDASVSVVRDEPYRLAADVWGIGLPVPGRGVQRHDRGDRSQSTIRVVGSGLRRKTGQIEIPDEAKSGSRCLELLAQRPGLSNSELAPG